MVDHDMIPSSAASNDLLLLARHRRALPSYGCRSLSVIATVVMISCSSIRIDASKLSMDQTDGSGASERERGSE